MTRELIDQAVPGGGRIIFTITTFTKDEEAPVPDAPKIDKPLLTGLFREQPETPEGKYLVKRRDGTVVEWPSFVLGARDPHAAYALRAYAESAAQDPKIDPGFVTAVFRLAHLFDHYRASKGHGDPGRGAHRADDPETVAEMKKGYSA